MSYVKKLLLWLEMAIVNAAYHYFGSYRWVAGWHRKWQNNFPAPAVPSDIALEEGTLRCLLEKAKDEAGVYNYRIYHIIDHQPRLVYELYVFQKGVMLPDDLSEWMINIPDRYEFITLSGWDCLRQLRVSGHPGALTFTLDGHVIQRILF